MKTTIFGKLLLLCCSLMFISSCSTSDDVETIFTGKTWKMSYIYYGSDYTQPIDLWAGDEDAYQTSLQLRDEAANFTLEFTGAEMDGQVSGTFSGRAAKTTVSGRWSADGDSKALSFTNVSWSGNESDVMAREFQTGINNAYKYSGDATVLHIHYMSNGLDRVISFTAK